MATTVGEAIVKLSFDGSGVKSELNTAEKHVSSFGSSVGSAMKKVGVAITAAFAAGTAAAVKFSKDSVNAFNEAEKAQAKLAQSAKNQNWAEGAVEDLRAYNSELQKMGIIEDDVNAAGQAQLGTFALSAEAVKTLTPAMDDLIAATSGYEATTDSATSMANLMGKVMTGNVGALTRYGVTLDENQKKLLQEGDEMTRAATLAEVLKQNYGGFNEALAKTPQGKVKQLSNAFGDLQESFGAFLAGRGDLNSFFDNLDSVLNTALDLIVDMAPQVMEGITKLLAKVNEKLPTIIEKLLPVITDIVIGLANALIENAPVLIDSAIKVTVEVIKAIIKNLPKIMESLAKAIPKAAGPIFAVIAGAAVLGKIKSLVGGLFTGSGGLKDVVSNGITSLGSAISSAVSSLMDSVKNILSGIGTAIANFIKAFAGPEVLAGALGFAAAAAAIAAAILLIGGAVGVVLPALEGLMNGVIIPLANFIVDTVIALIVTLTDAIINITQEAFIPLGEFLRDTFIAIVDSVTSVIERLVNNAVVPLVNVLSGALTNVLNAVSNLLNGIVKTALEGIAEIVKYTGEAFEHMGNAIKTALEGVSAAINAFADLIRAMAEGIVAIVALVTGHSINYGWGYAHLFAEGGRVYGPGTSTSDSVPAMLSNGEFVIKASSAKEFGYENLDSINNTGSLPETGAVHNWAGVLASSISGQAQNNRPATVNVYMTNEINSRLDAQDIGRVMMESIRRTA